MDWYGLRVSTIVSATVVEPSRTSYVEKTDIRSLEHGQI